MLVVSILSIILLNKEIAKMDNLNGYEFEDYIAMLLKKCNFRHVIQTSKNDDGGLDVLAEFHHVRYGFQCKHYKNRQVGRKVLKTTADGAHYYHVQRPVVITNRYFSRNAYDYQKFFKVELWDRSKLIQLIRVMINGF